jgi:hypothetical protein
MQAIQNRKTEMLPDKYRNVSVYMVEESTEDVFCFMMGYLDENSKPDLQVYWTIDETRRIRIESYILKCVLKPLTLEQFDYFCDNLNLAGGEI